MTAYFALPHLAVRASPIPPAGPSVVHHRQASLGNLYRRTAYPQVFPRRRVSVETYCRLLDSKGRRAVDHRQPVFQIHLGRLVSSFPLSDLSLLDQICSASRQVHPWAFP